MLQCSGCRLLILAGNNKGCCCVPARNSRPTSCKYTVHYSPWRWKAHLYLQSFNEEKCWEYAYLAEITLRPGEQDFCFVLLYIFWTASAPCKNVRILYLYLMKKLNMQTKKENILTCKRIVSFTFRITKCNIHRHVRCIISTWPGVPYISGHTFQVPKISVRVWPTVASHHFLVGCCQTPNFHLKFLVSS